jgi:hypothetical protein
MASQRVLALRVAAACCDAASALLARAEHMAWLAFVAMQTLLDPRFYRMSRKA